MIFFVRWFSGCDLCYSPLLWVWPHCVLKLHGSFVGKDQKIWWMVPLCLLWWQERRLRTWESLDCSEVATKGSMLKFLVSWSWGGVLVGLMIFFFLDLIVWDGFMCIVHSSFLFLGSIGIGAPYILPVYLGSTHLFCWTPFIEHLFICPYKRK